MFTLSARAGLLLCVAAIAIVTGPTSVTKAEPPVATKIVPQEKEAGAMPAIPEVAADAPPLRKAQLELIREGLVYLKRCEDLIRADVWVVSDFYKFADVLTETCRVAAELEEKPAIRVRWYEARVRQMKEVETLIDRGVRGGSIAPQQLTLIRFQRHQAEVDLLKLKAEVEKPKEK